MLNKDFEAYLLPNENILWVGACENSISDIEKNTSERRNMEILWDKIMKVIIIGMITGIPCFIVSMMFALITNTNPLYFFVPIVSIISIVFYRYKKNINKNNAINSANIALYNPNLSNNILYAMTNKRMLIKRGTINTKLSSIELKNISTLKLTEHYNKLCSIELMGKTIINKNTMPYVQFLDSVKGVENGLELYRLLNAHINTTV